MLKTPRGRFGRDTFLESDRQEAFGDDLIDGNCSVRHEFWINRQLELVVTGPDQADRIVLSQPYALIGSHPSCDVVLPDQRLPARCFLALLSASGLVGASLVRRSKAKFQPLSGDRGIRVGRFRIQFCLRRNLTRTFPAVREPAPRSRRIERAASLEH